MTPADLVGQLRTDGELTLIAKVIPRSPRNEVVGVMDNGTLKLKINAAPEKGKANGALCELLAEFFGVATRNVQIVRGETSHTKQIILRV